MLAGSATICPLLVRRAAAGAKGKPPLFLLSADAGAGIALAPSKPIVLPLRLGVPSMSLASKSMPETL